MGQSTSKAAKNAVSASSSASRRQYPQRIPPHLAKPQSSSPSTPPPPPPPSSSSLNPQPSSSSSTPGPAETHPTPQATSSRDEVIDLDGRDPDFGRSLRQLGPVTPSPTFSPSSTFHARPESQPSPSSPSATTTTTTNPHSRRPTPSGPDPDQKPQQQPVFPAPSTNPALQILAARERLAKEASEEISVAHGRRRDRRSNEEGQGQGRRFLDVLGVMRVVRLMEEGKMSEEEIERFMGLRRGAVARLGGRARANVAVVGTVN